MEEVITCSICQELFTDARTLSCTHCFCLSCLQDFQTTAIIRPCPLCRKDTVPAARELHRLPPNRAVNEMVGVLMKQKSDKNRPSPPAYTPRQSAASRSQVQQSTQQRQQPTQQRQQQQPKQRQTTAANPTKSAESTSRQQTTARTTSPPARITLADLLAGGRPQKTAQERRAEAMAEALAEAFVEALGVGGSSPRADNVHHGVQCDECMKTNITGNRYKCGICPNYDLCEQCERKPRMVVHDISHIFIKLKRPGNIRVPAGRVLDESVVLYGMKMNFTSNVHTATLPLLLLPVEIAINCDRCDKKPIVGKRFKCGMCDNYDLCEDCEQNSHLFHPADHVFLIIRHPSRASTPLIESKRLLRCAFYN